VSEAECLDGNGDACFGFAGAFSVGADGNRLVETVSSAELDRCCPEIEVSSSDGSGRPEYRIPTAGWWFMREKNLRFERVLDAVKEALESADHQYKYKRRDYVFVLNVDCGRHAIFIITRFNKGNFSVGVGTGVSIDAIEDIKAKIVERYCSPARWTFGIDAWEIESDIKKIPPVRSFFNDKGQFCIRPQDLWAHEKKYGARELDFLESDEELFSMNCSRLIERILRFGIPFVTKYGTLQGALELSLRNDRIAELCFLDPNKPLTGIIAAFLLGRRDRIEELHRNALSSYEKYKSLGNEIPLNDYMTCFHALKRLGVV